MGVFQTFFCFDFSEIYECAKFHGNAKHLVKFLKKICSFGME